MTDVRMQDGTTISIDDRDAARLWFDEALIAPSNQPSDPPGLMVERYDDGQLAGQVSEIETRQREALAEYGRLAARV